MVDIGNLRSSRYENRQQHGRKWLGGGRRKSRLSNVSSKRARDFVSFVRDVDLSLVSDVALRQNLDALGQSGFDDHHAVVDTFAIIAETIRRRIGAWRIFDLGFDNDAIEEYRVGSTNRLGPDETIAKTMAFVAEESKTRYFADISLSAQFYLAVEKSSIAHALRFEPTDEQIEAGWLMLDNTVVEMDAGEGKTIAAAFPAIVQALRGRKVHVITANDYLALRDAELLAPVYETLGLTIGALLGHMGDSERRSVYRNDIVYGTLREFGFDYLRDNLRYSEDDLAQSGRQVAIVDEADHALIDEARTPLIISGRPSATSRSVFRVKKAIEELIEAQQRLTSSLVEGLANPIDKRQLDAFARLFLVDPKHHAVISAIAQDKRLLSRSRTLIDEYAEDGLDNRLTVGLLYTVDVRRDLVALTDGGSTFIEERLGPVFDTADLSAEITAIDADRTTLLIERRERRAEIYKKISRQYGLVNQVHQMLRAYLLLDRDEEYIVSDGQIVLVDDLTGRQKSDNKYQHGLQTALEAKEGVRVRPDLETLAYLTVEGFVRQYDHVSGMTGTAVDVREQFRRSYGLEVARVQPTHASRRADLSPRVYTTQREKLDVIVDEVRHWHGIGRPVLIGTRTVEQSDEISEMITQADAPHNRLNAVTNADEARIIQEAGSFGAVTVATNMAGRGTDILLDDDLDERVTDRFVRMVDDLYQSNGCSIRIDCGHENVVNSLASGLTQLDVSFQAVDTTVIVDGSADEISLEFGLGLHVVGTQMNESARVDRQLRGRSGRQGQHGSSRFVLSLEDRPFVATTHSLSISNEKNTQEFVEKVQSAIEQDNEAGRIASSDFAQVIERQTLNYYEARTGILEDGDFHVTCEELVSDCIRRVVDRMISASEIGDYERRFDELVETVWLDLGLDVDELRGLGAEALYKKISEAVIIRFGDVAAALSPGQYTHLAKTMYLQVGDELWSHQLDLLQDMMLNALLSAQGHTRAVTEFVVGAEEAYKRFQEQVSAEFVSRLARFEIDNMTVDDKSIILVDDLEAILV